jgi:GAF domain-containing protein
VQQHQLLEILQGLTDDRDAGQGSGARLVGSCVSVLEVTGAGIMIMINGGHRGTLGSSDATMGVVEELQFTLGEGPCLDSYRLGQPVFEPSLADPITPRWPAFTPPALAAGVHAIFGFPLQIGAIRLGALDIYLNRPGSLTDEQLADALVMADVVTHEILELQAGAPPGALASELDKAENVRAVVHQASGMLSVQLDIPIADALIRLRAYTYANSRLVNEVAREIVAGSLHIE